MVEASDGVPTSEKEIKLRFPDPSAARMAVEASGARLLVQRAFEDNVLFDRRGEVRGAGCLLRLRTVAGGAPVVTFKGTRSIEEGVKSRIEIETTVGDAGAFRRILEGLGYTPVFRYQKYRETWEWGDAHVLVDETPIGVFVEIEGPLATIHDAARSIGAGPRDYIVASYAELFLGAGGKGDMIFRDGRGA